jgi:hypothetical protein
MWVFKIHVSEEICYHFNTFVKINIQYTYIVAKYKLYFLEL